MSGNVIGGVIGIGLSFASGGAFTPAMGWMVGSIAGGLLMPPEIEGPRLSDRRPQGSEYGRPIPIVYGTPTVQGNVIWHTDLVEVEGESGGKGGPSGAAPYQYFANFAVLLCEGEVTLGRIWAGPEKRLIYDGVSLEGGGTLTFYNGSDTQLPDPLMESHEGVGNVPAYRGYAYLVFEMFPVENDANRIPFLTVEISKGQAATDFLGLVNIQQAIVTDSYYVILYYGSTRGIMIRSLADHTVLEHHYQYELADWTGDDNWFWDETRDVLVRYDLGTGMVFDTLDPATGLFVEHTITAHGAAGPDPGNSIQFGMHYLGNYIFFAHGSGSTRTTAYLIDPDTFAAVATYTYDMNAEFTGPVFAPLGGGSYVFGCTTTGIRKYPLSAAASTDAGPIALSFGAAAAQDPVTGYIWSATDASSTTAQFVQCTDPETATDVYSDTIAINAPYNFGWGANTDATPFVFYPSGANRYVALCGGVTTGSSVIGDYALVFNATVPAFVSGGLGTLSGGNHLNTVLWNPTTSNLIGLRKSGYLSAATTATDPLTFPAAGDSFYLGEADAGTGAGQPLSEIVTDLCERAGLDASEIDVTDLTDTVQGYAVAQQTTVRGAIQVLQPAFYFDAVESAGVVKFVKRGGAVAVVIPDAELGAHESSGSSEHDLALIKRQMEDELPSVLTVTYLSQATKYETATKTARRLIGGSGDRQTLEAPIVMSDAKGQAVVDVNLHKAWVGGKTFAFSLPRKYSYLEPTDVIDILGGQTTMLTKVRQDGGVLKCDGVFDDFNYAPHVVATETPDTSGAVGTVYVPSPTYCDLMNLVALREVDTDAGFYAAACGYDHDNWRGAALYQSKDAGSSYTKVGFFANPAAMGATTDVLGSFTGGDATDGVNTVNVRLVDDTLTLSSTSATGFANGVNVAAIGDEIIYFQNATLEADGTYTLDTLKRGRFGSAAEIAPHAAGDRFVLLSASTVIRVGAEPEDIGESYLYKAVSVGESLDDVTAFAFTNTGAAYNPLAPVDVSQPATLFGRDPTTTTALTWGYYGGTKRKADGTLVVIPAGTVALTDNATNYIYATDAGVVTVTTVAPSGWPAPLAANATALYEVVTADGVIVSYIDYRTAGDGGSTSPTTTKGDLIVNNGTSDIRLPVGTDGQQLVADPTQAAGVKWASEPFDVVSFYPGVPTASAKMLRVPIARAVNFAANFSGSYGAASVAATASTAFDVQKNGVSVGTITFAAAGTTATFASSGGTAVSFAAGDVLMIVAPGSADATLADVGFALAGTR